MKKIAIWGFGSYGTRMLYCIRTYWKDLYEVSLICDRKFSFSYERQVEGLPACVPDELETYFAAGVFDAVLPAVAFFDQFEDMRSFLKERSIPVFIIGQESDFILASKLERAEVQWRELLPEGYNCTLHRNLYAISALRMSPLLLYDGEGHALIDDIDNLGGFIPHYMFQYPAPLDLVPIRPEILKGQYCVVGKQCPSNYWHFTYDSLDQLFLLEKLGFQGKYIINQSEYIDDFLPLLGIDVKRILWREDLLPSRIYCIEELFVLNSDPQYRFPLRAPVMTELAQTIKKKLVPDPKHVKYPSRVYFKRIGSRKLLGAEILLRKYGFVEIIPEELNLREQMELFYSADIVLCPHGAGATNSLYMHKGSVFLETFGKNWAVPHCIETLYHSGVYHLPVIQTPILDVDLSHRLDDYHVSPLELEMAIQAAIKLTERATEASNN